MALDDCIREVVEAAGEALTETEAKDLIKEVGELRLSKLEEEFDEAIKNAVEEEKLKGIIEKRNAYLNVLRRKDVLSHIDKFDSDYDGLRAILGGLRRPGQATRASIANRKLALEAKYLKGFLHRLETENLLKHFHMGENHKDIVRAIYQLSLGKEGNPGLINNPEAIKIAKVIKEFQDNLLKRSNEAGSWIRPLKGYISSQNHDTRLLREAGFETWQATVLENLDLERTMQGISPDRQDDFLRSVYDALVSGAHYKPPGGATADALTGFKGASSLGRKISEHRLLHFKDADAWLNYHSQFGADNPMMSIIQDFERSTNNIALMEVFGPNPQAFFDDLVQRLGKRNRQDLKEFDKITGKRGGLLSPTPQHLMAELTGETFRPENYGLAQVGSMTRQLNNMIMLGATVATQVTDVAFKANALRLRTGKPILSVYGDMIGSLFEGLTNKEKRRMAKAYGAGFDGTLQAVASRFMVDDNPPGLVSTLHSTYFNLNGVTPWTANSKMMDMSMIAGYMNNHHDVSFRSLHPQTQDYLLRANIDAVDWDIARSAARDLNGSTYILPDTFEEIPNDLIRSMKSELANATDSEIARYKKDLDVNYRGFLLDTVETATLTPSLNTRAILTKGTKPGTAPGEMLRFMSQFKSFGLAVGTDVFPELTRGVGLTDLIDDPKSMLKAAVNSDMAGIAHLVAMTTALGYMAMSMKDIAKGREPRQVDDPRTWAASFIQGGGAGIYADFLFGEYNRFGQGFLATVAGPTAGHVEDVASLYSAAVQGDFAAGRTFRTVLNKTPYLNLFYVRPALDYLILYDLQESLDPGFLNNLEHRIMENNGQKFFLPPSEVVPYGGNIGNALR